MFVFVLVFELGGSNIDMEAEPYYTAVISSYDYPSTDFVDVIWIYIRNMNFDVYVTFTLIAPTELSSSSRITVSSERYVHYEDFTKNLSSPVSIRYKPRAYAHLPPPDPFTFHAAYDNIEIVARRAAALLIAYEGMKTTLSLKGLLIQFQYYPCNWVMLLSYQMCTPQISTNG